MSACVSVHHAPVHASHTLHTMTNFSPPKGAVYILSWNRCLGKSLLETCAEEAGGLPPANTSCTTCINSRVFAFVLQKRWPGPCAVRRDLHCEHAVSSYLLHPCLSSAQLQHPQYRFHLPEASEHWSGAAGHWFFPCPLSHNLGTSMASGMPLPQLHCSLLSSCCQLHSPSCSERTCETSG